MGVTQTHINRQIGRETMARHKAGEFPIWPPSPSTSWCEIKAGSFDLLSIDLLLMNSTISRVDQDMAHKNCGPINHPVFKLSNPKVGKGISSEALNPHPSRRDWISGTECCFQCVSCMCAILTLNGCCSSASHSVCWEWDFSTATCCSSDIFLPLNSSTGRKKELIQTLTLNQFLS